LSECFERLLKSKGVADPTTPDLTGTKLEIVEAALETLGSAGYHGASAREIARVGGFNQALIFYHFGSVKNLLLAGLDLVSARRMEAYWPALERARTVPELAGLAREIYAADLEQGYVTVLGELVAGGMSDRELGQAVFARIDPWIALVERKLTQLLADSPLGTMVPARDVAFAIVALYLGIDMLSHLAEDNAAAESLLDLGVKHAQLAALFMPRRRGE
jgi:AcrR family transcriptional regulator